MRGKYRFGAADASEEFEEEEGKKKSNSGKGSSAVEEADTGALIYFYSEVERSKVLSLNKKLREKRDDALVIAQDYRLGSPPPIWLHINSYGGIITDGFAALDTMNMIKRDVDVNTVVDGICASAATFISCAGTKRYMHENALVLVHQMSTGFWGKYSELEDEKANSDLMMRMIKNFYKKHTKVPMKELDEILKHDLYWDAETCLKYKIVDEII